MPTGWKPAAASSTLEDWTRTFRAEGSNVCMPKFTKRGTRVEQPSVLNIFSELQYSPAFRRESRKFAGGVSIYATFRHFFGPPM